jgi:hypothetical protein
MIYGG